MTEPISLRRRNLLSLPSSSHLARSRREEEGGLRWTMKSFVMRHTCTCTHHRFPTSLIVPFWREKEQQLRFFPEKLNGGNLCLSCPQKRRSKRYVGVLYASYRLQHKPSGPKLVVIVIHVVCTPLGEDPLPARKKRKKGSKLFLHVAFL